MKSDFPNSQCFPESSMQYEKIVTVGRLGLRYDLQMWKAKLWAMYHVDVQRFTASNRLILTVFAGKYYVSLLGETNKLRHRSSLKALPRVSLSRELTRGRYDDCCCST